MPQQQATMIPPDPKDRAIHSKASAFVEARDRLKAAKHAHDEARDALVSTMEKKGRSAYRHADLSVELVDKGKSPRVTLVDPEEGREDEPPI